jgi:hypothetical protein
MEKLLTVLSSNEGGGSSSMKSTAEDKRQLTTQAKMLVGSCRSLPIHRTASAVATDVVEQTVRLVGRELLSRDPSFRSDQSRLDQPRYKKNSKKYNASSLSTALQMAVKSCVDLRK